MPRGTQPTVINYFSKPKWVSSQQYWEGWGEDERKTWPQSWRHRDASLGDFPGGPVVEDPPASSGATGLIPGLGRCRMPHAAEQLGPWAPATEALTPEACAPVSMRSPRTATREKLGQQRRLSTAEEKLITLERNRRGSTGLEILEILHEYL